MIINHERLAIVTGLIERDARDVVDEKSAIDYAARLRQHIKELSAIEKELTGELTGDVHFDSPTAQGNSTKLTGINFYLSVTESVRFSLDTAKLKKEFGQQWYDERCKISIVRGVKYYDNE